MIELDLAELARERQELEAAEHHYDHAIAGLAADDDRRRTVAHRGRASVRYRKGRAEEALHDYAAARAAATRHGDTETVIEILIDEATALDWANDAPASTARVDQAAALSQASGVTTKAIRAGLLVGQGRSLFRAGKWEEACGVLERAVKQAEDLGHPGYEPLVIALVMLEVVLPQLGRTDEAALVAERAVALARAKGDAMNLASALNNRRNVSVARKDVQGAIEDQKAFLQIGRDLGLLLNEYFAEYNIAELHYQSGNVEEARRHAERASAIEGLNPQLAQRPVAALLHARLLAFEGLIADARAVLDRIEAQVKGARESHHEAGALTASEQVLATMVDLSTRDASDAEWSALAERSARESLEQEPIEVHEMNALWALRRGRADVGRRSLDRALCLAARIPNVMDDRLRRMCEAMPELRQAASA